MQYHALQNARAVAVAMTFALVGARLSAQAPPSRPTLSMVGAAYDEARGRLVLVGGYTADAASVETWESDGNVWTRFSVPGPSARNEPLLVFDAARKRIVLYGGDRSREGQTGDTWAWDGARWQRLATDGPSLRGTSMVYDTRRDRIVLFGGGEASGRLYNDTWEWDGNRWQRIVNDSVPGSPPARALAGMAYDPRRGRTVLFGGFAGVVPGTRIIKQLDDTWEWDGTRWKQIVVPGPAPRDHVAMTYDATRSAVLLHGGGSVQQNGSPALVGDTWSFDGTTWTRLADGGPRRGRHRLLYDASRKSVLLYGGWTAENTQSSELWSLENARWSLVPPSR